MDRVVIIIPTYNEAKNIGRMIEVLFNTEFPKITNVNMFLLVVDDNSPDGTGEIIKTAMKKYKNLHILEGKKEGLGMAYVRGMRYAMNTLRSDATIEMDADFQHDPKYVKDLVNAYAAGADYVIGSRYIKGGSIPEGWEFYRKAISFFGNFVARVMLFLPHIHDLTTGFRLTRVKGVLDKIDLENLMELRRFAFKVDLLYKSIKLSKKTVEVPIAFAERTQEVSKFNPKEITASYKVLLLLRYHESKRFIKFGTVGFIGYLINALGLEFFAKLGMGAALASAVAAECSIISNFIINNLWTFQGTKSASEDSVIKKFLKFNFTSLGAITVQSVIVGLAVYAFGDTGVVRQLSLLAALAIIIPMNYILYNVFIWKTWKTKK